MIIGSNTVCGAAWPAYGPAGPDSADGRTYVISYVDGLRY